MPEKPSGSSAISTNRTTTARVTFTSSIFYPDHSPTGYDSTQKQLTDNHSSGYSFRASYDRPLNNNRTFVSVGSFYNFSSSNILVDASYLKSADKTWEPLDLLSNDFRFRQ